MKIETTVNLKQSIHFLLSNASEINQISRSRIISVIIAKLFKYYKNELISDKAVKYQNNTLKERWKKQHIFLSIKEYEMLVDMRKFRKLSVSYIISDGIKKYLKDIIEEIENDDNYQISNDYFMGIYKENRSINYHITWGRTRNHQKTIYIHQKQCH